MSVVIRDRTNPAQQIAVNSDGSINVNGISAPVLTKATQGVTGYSVQQLRDAGRNLVHYYTVLPVLTTAGDVLQSLTGTKSGATVNPSNTPAVVTIGKTFRVTRFSAAYISTATGGFAMVRLRFNPAGLVAITSPIAAQLIVGNPATTTVNAASNVEADLNEGLEFAAGTGIGISVAGYAGAMVLTACGYVECALSGYEY